MSILGFTHSGHPLDAWDGEGRGTSEPPQQLAGRPTPPKQAGLRRLDRQQAARADGCSGRLNQKSKIKNRKCTSSDLHNHINRRVTFIGWLVMMRHAVTNKHEYMKFLCLEDRSGVVEVVVFPDVYRRWGHEMADGGVYCVEGLVKEQHGALSLVAETARSLSP